MGGHGGLNILPQKRWNVYNFDNRERVRKDEEAAAREEQVRLQKARHAELEFKLGKLKDIAQSKRRRLEAAGSNASLPQAAQATDAIVARDDESDAIESRNEKRIDAAERPQFINLFAEFEEREGQEGHGSDHDKDRGRKRNSREKGGRDGSQKGRNEQRGVEKVDGKPTGEPVNENYGLGHGAVDKNGKKPWYAVKSFMVDRAQDDMERPEKKSGTAGRVEAFKSKAQKKTIEELRAERIKREQEEKYKLLRLKAGKSATGYERLPSGRVPQYHGSFGNARY